MLSTDARNADSSETDYLFSAGSVMTKVDLCPSPGDSAQICPPWASMRARAMGKPIPLGFIVLVVLGVVWLVRAVGSGNQSALLGRASPSCGLTVQADGRNCPPCGTQLLKYTSYMLISLTGSSSGEIFVPAVVVKES